MAISEKEGNEAYEKGQNDHNDGGSRNPFLGGAPWSIWESDEDTARKKEIYEKGWDNAYDQDDD